MYLCWCNWVICTIAPAMKTPPCGYMTERSGWTLPR